MTTTKEPNSVKMATLQNQKKEDHDDHKTTAVDTVSSPPQLPDDLIHLIIQLLPTKYAIRMSTLSKQFDAAWHSQPVLDFDEGKSPDDTSDINIRHAKFVNILNRYLGYFQNKEKVKQRLLDKFRLHTAIFSVSDSTMLDDLLSLAIRRSAKELDVSIGGNEHAALYCLTPKSPLFTAKSITTLSLEHVNIHADEYCKSISLLSLKTMSLKCLRFSQSLVSGCPSIEYLSLYSCSMGARSGAFVVSNFNLKSLAITYCDFSHVHLKTNRLESFTFVSESYGKLISLYECRNLKCLSIFAQKLRYLFMSGCEHFEKARISSRSLRFIQFTGFSENKLSIEAQNLDGAIVTLGQEKQTFKEPWEKFSSLRDFLESFASCAGEIILRVEHVEALIFPEHFRKTVSPLLPILKHFIVQHRTPKNSDLMDSLTWIAPSAEIKFF